MSDFVGPSMPFKKKPATANEAEILNDPALSSQNENIGPSLPEDLKKMRNEQIGPSSLIHCGSSIEDDSYGPQMPVHLRNKDYTFSGEIEQGIGLSLPPHLLKVAEEDNDEEEFGPAPPPGFSNKPKQKTIGPSIPPGLLTQSSDEEEEELVIGPLPPSVDVQKQSRDAIARDFEKRCQKMKGKLEGRERNEKLKREEWMTELPPVLQGTLGVGPRQFRARALDIGDRSGWTDTPADKARKAKENSSGKDNQKSNNYTEKRDARIADQLKEFKGADERQESLLSTHEKKRKRKLKEAEKSGEANLRRPFDRELDLQTNRFDEAAKKRMLKQSAGLSSRFAHGHTSGTFL